MFVWDVFNIVFGLMRCCFWFVLLIFFIVLFQMHPLFVSPKPAKNISKLIQIICRLAFHSNFIFLIFMSKYTLTVAGAGFCLLISFLIFELYLCFIVYLENLMSFYIFYVMKCVYIIRGLTFMFHMLELNIDRVRQQRTNVLLNSTIIQVLDFKAPLYASKLLFSSHSKSLYT
jgi:hypothetical protein